MASKPTNDVNAYMMLTPAAPLQAGYYRLVLRGVGQLGSSATDSTLSFQIASTLESTVGDDTAATEYFKRQSSEQLTEAFAPIVHQAMENVGVVRQYNQFMRNPMAARLAARQGFNLDEYVVGKTMDGLFYVMAEEEKKIRKDPMAQTTSLLREVFGRKQ